MKIILALMMIVALQANANNGFYNLSAVNIHGETIDFSKFAGKKLLIVNTASQCGYTYQYELLQELYQKYGGENFEIIGFPSNDFGSQEPGEDEDIWDFCQNNYSISFTMMSKISVKGMNTHPVYKWLTKKDRNGVMDSEVKWNFQKYLINEDGTLESFYLSNISPMATEIQNWISKPSDVEISSESKINLYPNPASDYIEISLGSNYVNKGLQPLVHVGEIAIYDVLGDVVWKSTENTLTPALSLREREHRIDISHLPRGVYFVRFGERVERFVKR